MGGKDRVAGLPAGGQAQPVATANVSGPRWLPYWAVGQGQGFLLTNPEGEAAVLLPFSHAGLTGSRVLCLPFCLQCGPGPLPDYVDPQEAEV